MSRWYVMIVIIWGVLTQTVWSYTPYSDIQSRLVSYNHVLKQAALKVTQSAAKRRVAKAQFLPTVTGIVNRAYNDQRGTRQLTSLQALDLSVNAESLSLKPIDSYELGVYLEQPIIDWTLYDGVKVSYYQWKVAQAQYRQTQQELIRTSLSYYLTLLKSPYLISLYQYQSTVLSKQVAQLEAELSNKLVTKETLLKAKLALIQSKRQLADTIHQANQAKMSLNQMTGYPIKHELIPTVTVSESQTYIPVSDAIGILETVIQKDPTYHELDSLYHQVRYESKQTKHRYYPSIQFSTQYGYVHADRFKLDEQFSDYSWKVYLKVPIFNGFQSLFYYGYHHARLEEVAQKASERKEQLALAAASLLHDMDVARHDYEMSRVESELYLERLNAVKSRVALRQATTLDEDLARFELREKQVTVVIKRFELLEARALYALMMGEDVQI